MMTLDQIVSRLKEHAGMEDKRLWIIKIDNTIIRLRNKIAWKKIGHAKNALRHFLKDVKYGYDSLVASGRVDFVVIDLV